VFSKRLTGDLKGVTEDEQIPDGTNNPDDKLIQEEEDAAAAEAARIGGRSGMEGMGEAERASAEHGGGESEGFEEAEELLKEQASHGDPAVDPLDAAFEVEREKASAVSGEADSVRSTEIVDPQDESDREP
jgi:hypothetical protein